MPEPPSPSSPQISVFAVFAVWKGLSFWEDGGLQVWCFAKVYSLFGGARSCVSGFSFGDLGDFGGAAKDRLESHPFTT